MKLSTESANFTRVKRPLISQNKNIFSVDAYFLTYKDSSTNRWYMKSVRKELAENKSADEAQAGSHHFTLKQYQSKDFVET